MNFCIIIKINKMVFEKWKLFEVFDELSNLWIIQISKAPERNWNIHFSLVDTGHVT